MDKHQFARTMSIIKELAKGKRLTVGRHTLVMGDDMTIGFLMTRRDGSEFVTSSITLKGVNDLCEQYEVGMAIPERYVK